jgi:hypothetical protein
LRGRFSSFDETLQNNQTQLSAEDTADLTPRPRCPQRCNAPRHRPGRPGPGQDPEGLLQVPPGGPPAPGGPPLPRLPRPLSSPPRFVVVSAAAAENRRQARPLPSPPAPCTALNDSSQAGLPQAFRPSRSAPRRRAKCAGADRTRSLIREDPLPYGLGVPIGKPPPPPPGSAMGLTVVYESARRLAIAAAGDRSAEHSNAERSSLSDQWRPSLASMPLCVCVCVRARAASMCV